MKIKEKYILFDLDGTLTDPKEGITKSVSYALEKFNIQADLDSLVDFIGPPLKFSFMEYYNFPEEKAIQAIEYYRERFSLVGIYENKIYDGIIETLKKLVQNNKVMAVATSKPTIYAKQICEDLKLVEYFQYIVGTELNQHSSDKKDIINEAIKQLGCSKNEVIMVGDRKFDILGAKACGISCIGVTYGYGAPNELSDAGADYIIDKPTQLI